MYGWYDLVITVEGDPGFEYHFAGHVETGEDSISDPAIGASQSPVRLVRSGRARGEAGFPTIPTRLCDSSMMKSTANLCQAATDGEAVRGGEGIPVGSASGEARALCRPSVLDPPFTFEREGADLKEVDVPLDAVPILAVHSSQDGRVFLLAHLPPSGVPCDDEPMNAFLVDQAAIE
jgi:hypothetical protein